MFKKPKTPKQVPLSERSCRPRYTITEDVVVKTSNGNVIKREDKPNCREQFTDLGDAECYGVLYSQTKGIELPHVENRNRVSPIEAIHTAEEFINNLNIPQNETT